jgi:hypothetical protein
MLKEFEGGFVIDASEVSNINVLLRPEGRRLDLYIQ